MVLIDILLLVDYVGHRLSVEGVNTGNTYLITSNQSWKVESIPEDVLYMKVDSIDIAEHSTIFWVQD